MNVHMRFCLWVSVFLQYLCFRSPCCAWTRPTSIGAVGGTGRGVTELLGVPTKGGGCREPRVMKFLVGQQDNKWLLPFVFLLFVNLYSGEGRKKSKMYIVVVQQTTFGRLDLQLLLV